MTGLAAPLTGADLVQLLENEITDRTWAPNSKLPSERHLSERYGVSRPAVREALRQMQAKGLIQVHPGRGSFVADLRPIRGLTSVEFHVQRGDVTPRHLVAARRMLECEAAALAAANRSPEQIAELRDLVTEFENAENVALAVGADVALHEAICVAAGNPVLQILFGAIREFVEGMAMRSLSDPEVRAVGGPLHGQIVEAIAEGEPERARTLMSEHICLALELYGTDLDRALVDVIGATRAARPQRTNTRA